MTTAADIIYAQSAGSNGQEINTICLGSGRFLRSVLVPFLSFNSKPGVFQTRGRTFLDSFKVNSVRDDDGDNVVVPSLSYPVDTIEFDGSTTTTNIDIYAAGTLGTADGKSQLMENLISNNVKHISVIGVGVTEAGLQSATNQCMLDLTELLHKLFLLHQAKKFKCPDTNDGRICIINTDNVPNNGDVIRKHMLTNAKVLYDNMKGQGKGGGEEFLTFLETKVAFLNSMVDRITSSRANSNGLIPSCEPLPNKALVICDPNMDLPSWMNEEDVKSKFGVKIRNTQNDLESDISLKLRVANGTHTAIAHVMALLGLVNTEALCDAGSSNNTSKILMSYLDSLFETQLLPGAIKDDGITADETNATWEDWRRRLQHPHFGLSTFFITQNGAAKCGIRLGPTIKSLVLASSARGHDKEEEAGGCPLTVSMAFAVAAILRFFTPATNVKEGEAGWSEIIDDANQRNIYVGWLDGNGKQESSADGVTYADGLRYNLSQGWYEFRCNCVLTHKTATAKGSNGNDDKVAKCEMPLPDMLANCKDCKDVISSYLLHPQGGDLQSLLNGDGEDDNHLRRIQTQFDIFVNAVSALYAKMVCGDSITTILQEMMDRKDAYTDGFATTAASLKYQARN